MAFGTEAGVTLKVGGLTNVITSANIALAIAQADVWVDYLNSSASATIKTEASNIIASDIMLNAQAKHDSRGSTRSQTAGEPAVAPKVIPIPSSTARSLLRSGRVSFRTDLNVT